MRELSSESETEGEKTTPQSPAVTAPLTRGAFRSFYAAYCIVIVESV